MTYLRGAAIWLVIILVEFIHGTARKLLLEPYFGDFRARQVSVFTGAVIILLITFLCTHWLRAANTAELLGVGLLWLALTVAFEILLGRAVFGYSWERIGADYNLARGGLMPLGLLALTLAPWLASHWRSGAKRMAAPG